MTKWRAIVCITQKFGLKKEKLSVLFCFLDTEKGCILYGRVRIDFFSKNMQW